MYVKVKVLGFDEVLYVTYDTIPQVNAIHGPLSFLCVDRVVWNASSRFWLN